jgi:DNA-directed RNA polymerase delta subunit
MDNNKAVRNENMLVSGARDEKPRFLSLADNLLSTLNERSQEIIKKRFGLRFPKGETLEKIGQEHGITRERIRQIIAEAIRGISAKSTHADFLEAEEKIIFTIKSNNGIIKETDIIEKFNSDGPKEANAIRFFANCSKKIFEIEEKGFLEKSWVVSEEISQDVKRIIAEAEKIIQKERKLFADQEISQKIMAVIPDIKHEQVMNFLNVSARIKKDKFFKWGMSDWMEVNPKGTREKVYLILKQQGKPLHFTEIAFLIDKYKLGKRKAHPQTVHNELIKNERFVLIGRGIYALREWGYFEGTIREIIEKILSQSGNPMKRQEIIDEVLKMRKVKKTTIMINLNNRKFFEWSGELYSLKK